MKARQDSKSKRPKVNPLRPAERDKKRYVAFEIFSDKPASPEADKELFANINSLLGVFESAKAGLMRVKYNAKAQRGLFRIDRDYVDKLRSCFVMTKQLSGAPVLVRTLRVSGMIHKAEAEINVQGLTRKN